MKTKFLFLLTICLMATSSLFAQKRNVTGQVVSQSDGEPLIGVTIAEKGNTSKGTVTDLNGKFSIDVNNNTVLVISYIGYVTQEITPKGSAPLKIRLKEDSKMLDEVVAVGYGVQKKSDLTGSVSSVGSSDLKTLSTTDAAAALQGKASGVQILNYSGAPGQGASIRVRGYSSNGGNTSPLLIVDGLQVDNIQYLDPSMIESIEILKDAASAAIYGAQAGNGVVLITTKNGKSNDGRASVTYDAKFIIQSLAHKPEIFDAESFIDYKRMSGLKIDEMLKQNNYDGTNTDWLDVVFGNSFSHQHSLTFQGDTNRSKFFASLNMLDNNGIVRGSRDVYKRMTSQINAEFRISDWLTVGSNNSIEKWKTKSVPHMSQYGSVMNSAMTLDPLTPVYYESPDQFAPTMAQAYGEGKNILKDPSNGLYYATSKYMTDDSGNPLLQRDRVDSYNSGWSVRGTMFANFNPIKGLIVTSRLGYRISQSNSHSYDTPYYATPQAKSDDYHISASANNGYFYQWENFANYNTTIAKKHNIGAMVGMSFIKNKSDNVSASGQGPDILKGYEPNFRYISYLNSLDTTVKGLSNSPSESTQMAYFGRLSYNYDNKYFLQANFRRDAFDSSKLSTTNRWGNFPSFSAGWTVSNEEFFKNAFDQKDFSFLKIRASWGRNGNISVLSGYPYAPTISYNAAYYQYNVDKDGATYGSRPSGLANPNLMWETSEQLDLGIDARFLNNRLTVGIDYYNKNTKDLLVGITPLPEIGVSSATINGGKVNNKGLEIQVGWKDHIGDLNYSINANCSWLKNKVTELPESIDRLYGTEGGVQGTNNKINSCFEVGQPIWYFRGYKYLGVDKETGNAIIQDTNKDGQVTPEDMTYIGQAIPKFTYGLTINLEYKGFDLNVFGTGVSGNDIFTVFYRADTPMRNSLRYYYDNAWTPENHNAKMPNPAAVVNDWTFWSSSASMFSGAFFKIKQIQLGYTLPKALTTKFGCQNMRVYMSLDDFFTFTKYPGMDPETATTNLSSAQMGYDNGTYPMAKKIIAGLSFTF